MQTIRIYRRSGGLVASFSGAPGFVETAQMRSDYPESYFMWLR